MLNPIQPSVSQPSKGTIAACRESARILSSKQKSRVRERSYRAHACARAFISPKKVPWHTQKIPACASVEGQPLRINSMYPKISKCILLAH